MKKSFESFLSANRRAFFVIGVVFCLSVFGIIAWQTKAQENPTADSPSGLQKQTYGVKSDNKTQAEPVNNEASVIELPYKIDRDSLPTGPHLASPAVGTDLGTEIEPNDTFATATNLPGSEVKIRGDVFGNGDLDWFRFTAAAGDRVYAAVMTSYSSSASTDSQLRLFASDGTTVIEFDEDDGSLGGLSSTIAGATIPTPGTYYLQVKHFSATNTLRPYEMYLKVQAGAPTPEVEANDTPATANPLPPSGWVSGARNPAVATEQDWYSFTANAGDTVYLGLDLDPERDVTTWNGRLGIALFGDANNQILVVDDAGAVDTIDSETMIMTVKTAGTYYAFVDSATAATGGPTATYNLSVTIIPKTNVGVNCTTYTSTNVPLPIADGALTSSTITVPATTARIASTKVSINATHTLMGDMDVQLRSPGNNNNGLFNDIGAAATGGQTLMDLTLDQYSSGVPFVFTVVRPMVLKPELSYRLDWFDGENPSGVWTLDIRDDLVNATTGTLNGWSLEICEQPAVAGSVIYTEDFEANNGGYTLGTVGQLANEWEYGTPATLATTTSPPVADIIGCNSGTNCWKTDLDNTYDLSSNQDLVSPNITLPNQNGTATLTWAMRYQMESATFDHARVTINEVGGMGLSRTVWQWTGATMTTNVGAPTAVNIGNSAGWGIYQAKIDDFASFAGRTINITFHVDSDTSVNLAGVAIDDVQLRFVPTVVDADLAITKTDGVTSVNAGTTTTYTIVASNAGPSNAPGTTVADTFPAAIVGATWTCVGAGGGTCTAAGAGNINDTVNLPAGGSVTYTVTAPISAAATGSLVNTATVTAGAGVTDPNPGNNSATDTDTIIPIGCQGGGNCTADLSITKTDGLTTVNPGQMITYTIVASNLGPTGVNGASVTDNFPAALTGVTWTCVGGGGGTCPAGGTGNINALVNLPVNGTATFTATATVSPAATFAISNTAQVTPPVGATDPVPGNNSARDTDAICAPNPTIFAYNLTGDRLVRFNADTPGTLATDIALTGMAGNENLVGIDFRPATGTLMGVATNLTVDRVVTINTATGAVTSVGGTLATGTGSSYGFDFNPVPDRIRFVDDGDNSRRLNPNDGTLAAVDTNIAYAPGDPGAGSNPAVVHVAYDRSVAGATSTTLYGIDVTRDVLVRIGGVDGIPSPNGGQLTTIGPLGVDATSAGGFDIEPVSNAAYAALRVGAVSNLYRINLTTGAATLIGAIGGGTTIDGIAIASGGCPTTAAGVTVSGRVFTPDGYGLRNAVVTITDSTGMIRTARTTSFGYYTFEGIEVGGAYVVNVASKSYTFTPRTVTVNDAINDLDFIGNGPNQ